MLTGGKRPQYPSGHNLLSGSVQMWAVLHERKNVYAETSWFLYFAACSFLLDLVKQLSPMK